MDAEMIAKEHEAGKKSVIEIVRFTKRERDEICNKIRENKAKYFLEPDEKALESIPEQREDAFERQWNLRKQSLTRHAKFCLFTTSVKQIAGDLDELHQTINSKCKLEENIASVTSSQGTKC
jgi:hypothetical protein